MLDESMVLEIFFGASEGVTRVGGVMISSVLESMMEESGTGE